MADTKISAAADIVSLTSTDMLPVARSGSATAYHATMAEMSTWANTNLPTASTSTLGAVKIDGSTITISGSGVISGATPVSPSSAIPAMDGTGAAGAALAYSRGDHIHPSDTTRAPLASPTFTGTVTIPSGAAIAGYAPLASPTFTGTPAAPTPTTGDSSTKLATTAFVQAQMVASGAGVSSFNTRTGPVVLQQSDLTALGEYNDTGRNILHNPLFTVQQRTGPWTANGAYTADRWLLSIANDTVSVSIATLADADRTGIGDETATFALQAVFTGSATAGSLSLLGQRVENVRRLSGRAITLSFWAKASSGTPKLGGFVNQVFGSGGSPSATVNTTLTATPALSTTWTRYTMSGSFPSAAGKVFGTTAGSDYSTISLWLSDQGNASGTGIGVQSGTVQLWGVQLEYGSAATSLAKRDPQQEWALAQRFFCASYAYLVANGTAGGTFGTVGVLPVTMRAAPTVTATTNTNTNWTYSGAGALAGNSTIYIYGTATATGATTIGQGFTASADL